MATLALSLGGALAGSLIGGPIGGRIGFLAGQFIGNALFGNADDRVVEGPRLTDLSVTASSYGRPIPIAYGANRIGGNVIWSPGLKEHRQEESQGAKGGGPSVTVVTFTYTANFRIGFCEGTADAVLKVWADGKLIVDASGDGPMYPTKIRENNLRYYLGDEAQEADPVEEADLGLGNVPAYRGLVSILFRDFPLEDFGNRIPQITALIAKPASARFAFSQVANDGFFDARFALLTPDKSAFIATDNIGLVQKLDLVGRAVVWESAIEPEIPVGARDSVNAAMGMDADGNVYVQADPKVLFDTDGTLWKIDPNAGQIVARSLEGETTFGDRDAEEVIVAGVPPNEIVIVISQSGRVIASYETEPGGGNVGGLPQLTLRSKLALFDSNWTRRSGLAVDADGFLWMTMALAGQAKLLKLDPVVPQIVATYDLAGVAGGENFLAYLPELHSLIILAENSPARFIRFSIDLASFDAEFTVNDSVQGGDLSRYVFRNGPLNGRMWLVVSEIADTRMEVDFIAMQHVRTISLQPWPNQNNFLYSQYDPVNNALIGTQQSGGNDIGLHMLDRADALGVPLSDIADDIASRVGLSTISDVDSNQLDDSVLGFVISDRMPARRALESLAPLYFFDVREEDFVVQFLKRGAGPLASIADVDLGARRPGAQGFVAPISELRRQELDLPREIEVVFADPAADHQTNTQRFQRISEAVSTRKRLRFNLPVVMAASEAAQRVERLGYQFWTERSHYELSLSRRHMRLTPGDVVVVDEGTDAIEMRITRIDSGPDGILRIAGLASDAQLYKGGAAVGAAALGVPGQSLDAASPTSLYVIDLPLLRDRDDGLCLYMAGGASGAGSWSGASIHKSADGFNYDPVAALSADRNAVHGYTLDVLAAGSHTRWDRINSVTLRLLRGALSSRSELEVLNGANALMVGNEYLQFAEATLNADGSYRLSNLLRGRRGTEWAVSDHVRGEPVILASAAHWIKEPLSPAEIGAKRYFKAITVGGNLQGTNRSLIFQGRSLMPLAPVHLRASLGTAPQDWTLTWVRRTRIGGAWANNIGTVALGEESERYDLEILNGTDVVRSITGLSTTSALYSESQQISDFGSVQTDLHFRVYQISATVGRGFPASAQAKA